MAGLQKSGYLEVKEPSNIKGRKLKAWKHKWVVLQEMSNLASGTLAAKLELYQTEASAIKNSQDKITYLLENVTAVESCHSKTHKLAFQIVVSSPMLVLCADTEFTTNAWITTLKKIFFAEKNAYHVEIIPNSDSKRFELGGQYRMTISPEAMIIENAANDKAMGWKLDTLKRFYMESGISNVLVIESGAKAECGDAKFQFKSNDVAGILQSIRNNIQKAIEERRLSRSVTDQEGRTRALSTTSFEQGFQTILRNSHTHRTSSVGSDSNVSIDSTAFNESKTSSDKDFKIIGENNKPDKVPQSASASSGAGNSNTALTKSPLSKFRYAKNTHCRTNSLDRSLIYSSEKLDSKRNRANSLELSFPGEKRNGYDFLQIKPTKDIQKANIVSTLTIRSPEDKEIELGVDSYGYSHVTSVGNSDTSDSTVKRNDEYSNINSTDDSKDNPPEDYQNQLSSELVDVSGTTIRTKNKSSEEERCRAVSDISVQSNRSSSVGSQDSGVSNLHTGRTVETDYTNISDGCRDGGSFDSAISNSDSVTASVSDAIVVSENNMGLTLVRSSSQPVTSSLDTENNFNNSIYSEVEHQHNNNNNNKHNRSKSEPVGYESIESEYEDLDKYRKDLKQFLGIDSHVTPEEVPPSLPERPSSMPAKRKVLDKRKKKVSFPLIIKPRKSNRSESSSSSSSDDDEKVGGSSIVKISSWPLDNTRVANSLYSDSSELENSRISQENTNAKPVNSVTRWPLKMTAQANCNRFYEFSEQFSQLPQLPPRPEQNSSNTVTESPSENKRDDITPEEHIYASVDANTDKIEHVHTMTDLLTGDTATDLLTGYAMTDLLTGDAITDLLTGETPDLPSVTSPVMQPVPFDQLFTKDLLSWDSTDTIDIKDKPLSPSSTTSSLDLQTDFHTLSPKRDDTEDSKNIASSDGTPVHVKTRRKGDVINPFPNLARYSGAAEDLLKLNDSDPFDIFHLGVISNSFRLPKGETDSNLGTKNVDTSNIDMLDMKNVDGEKLLLDSDLDTEESLYMHMGDKQNKTTEEDYVVPSLLQ